MLEQIRKRMPGLTSFQLKLIALVTMSCDHYAVAMLNRGDEAYWVLRTIGRIAFPLFAFMLVEGFYHTRDVKKYSIRLLIFALLSEVPFDLLVTGRFLSWQVQNIYFTLFIGLVMLAFMEQLRLRGERWQAVGVGVAAMGAALLLRTDYDAGGVLLIFFFYQYRQDKMMMCLMTGAVMAFFIGGLEVFGIVALAFILLYNGKKGSSLINKYVFYGFYPAHMLALWFVARLLAGFAIGM